MSEETWRNYLYTMNKLMDAEQKRAFYRAIGVSRQTFDRWRRGEDWPQRSNLVRLLKFLSEEERSRFLQLLKKDDARAWSLLPEDVRETTFADGYGNTLDSAFQHEELDNFCLKLLRLQRDTPDRTWQVGRAILHECVTRLETHPVQAGIEVSVATCMPPQRDGKVRSLREIVGIGTPPWREDFHEKDFFLGIETLAGQAVNTRRGQMIPNFAHGSPLSVAPRLEHERCAASFPIMHVTPGPTPEMSIAGALVVSCAQAGYFTARRMDILEIFADIIRLAYSEDVYYPASLIELAPMPPPSVQSASLDVLFMRVLAEDKRLKAEGSDLPSGEVEKRVRAEIELELLHLASSSPLETTFHARLES